MPTPLVLKNGRICEELTGEVGVYPYLRLSSGRLRAGGSGNPLRLLNGRIVEYIEGAANDTYFVDDYFDPDYYE